MSRQSLEAWTCKEKTEMPCWCFLLLAEPTSEFKVTEAMQRGLQEAAQAAVKRLQDSSTVEVCAVTIVLPTNS